MRSLSKWQSMVAPAITQTSAETVLGTNILEDQRLAPINPYGVIFGRL